MRILFSFLLSVFLLSGCAPRKPALWASSRDSSYVFDLKALPVITIRVSPDEWTRLNSLLRKNHRSETSVRADFVFEKNGRRSTVENVGFRLRGSVWTKQVPEPWVGNFRNVNFRIGFNTFDKKKRFFGLRKLLIRSFRADPLYARQVLGLDLMNRFGAYAPRASYARLVLRIGKRRIRYGVHALVEAVDSVFLQSRFRENRGQLWKCLSSKAGGHPSLANTLPLSPQIVGIEVHRDEPLTNFQPAYDLKRAGGGKKKGFSAAKGALESFIKNLNTLQGEAFEKWAGKTIDIDGLLRTYAMHVLTGNWDDYWFNGKNYYLYRNLSGIWRLITDDYDHAFGTGFKWAGGHDFTVRDVFGWGQKDRPLMNKILARPRFRTIYAGYLRKALADGSGLFTVSAVRKRLRSFHDLIRPFVHPDKTDIPANDFNHRHRIEDSPFMKWDATPVKYRMLSGGEKDSYLDRRINSARKQLKQNQ